ncbi:antithrombin-iii-like isoform 2 protein [Lasius niger]|uniref:Antithrombin-iii-like isoform 2 protein n=1 Tax=Lasius niger TaxID=67767 RepID=A0A0J7MSH7_LASNI|nr:antithrombin-iii-like isoform 2 protein [Lasius niger]
MHVIEFPYTNENKSLFVFIPGSLSLDDYKSRRFPIDDDLICDLIERLSTEEGICTLRNLLDSDIPPSEDCFLKESLTFEVERNLPMRELLQLLYIEQLLKPDAINLDSFFVDDDSVHLGNVVHRTHIKVTEEDTVAGAVNMIRTGQEDCLVRDSLYEIRVLGFTFPFIWLIYDKQRRNVLFAGSSTYY